MKENTPWADRFLELARLVSTWSKDPSRKIGAVAVDPKTKKVLSTGYNGFPKRIEDSEERLNTRAIKYKYVVHAEMSVIYNSCSNGVCLEGADLYVYGLPVCCECAKGIVQVGIKRVFIHAPEDVPEIWLDSWKISKEIFDEAKVNFTFVKSIF